MQRYKDRYDEIAEHMKLIEDYIEVGSEPMNIAEWREELLKIEAEKTDKQRELERQERELRKQQDEKLAEYNVYPSMYGSDFPKHPDGIHCYELDSDKAIRLIRAGEELSEDLKERLLYYKSIWDEFYGVNIQS